MDNVFRPVLSPFVTASRLLPDAPIRVCVTVVEMTQSPYLVARWRSQKTYNVSRILRRGPAVVPLPVQKGNHGSAVSRITCLGRFAPELAVGINRRI